MLANDTRSATGYSPAVLRRHPGLRAPYRPTWGGVFATACLFAVALLAAAWLLQLI